MAYYVLKHGEKMLGGIMQIDPSWGEFHPQWMPLLRGGQHRRNRGGCNQAGGKVMCNVDDSPFGRLASP